MNKAGNTVGAGTLSGVTDIIGCASCAGASGVTSTTPANALSYTSCNVGTTTAASTLVA